MTAPTVTAVYAQQRARDWEAFAAGAGPLTDYWAEWESRAFSWKCPVEFLQPLGTDVPDRFAPLAPLLRELSELEEVDVPPIRWLHTTYVRVGFLRPDDVLWSQVESFYVNAAPRIRRVEPFAVHLAGISVADDERIYLGVDDGGSYRELRRQIRLGVPFVYEKMKDDPLLTPEGDHFVPTLDLGYFTGRGSRARVTAVLERYRDIDLGAVALTHMKLARVPVQPHDYYIDIDIVAEIPLLGADHRKGYHN